MFEDVGHSFCLGVLDMIGANPVSRVPTSQYKCLDGVKRDLICGQHIQMPQKVKQQIKDNYQAFLDQQEGPDKKKTIQRS